MRNVGLLLAAVAVLVVGLVLVQGADDGGGSTAGTSSVDATTPAASTPTASTPAATTPSTPAGTTPSAPSTSTPAAPAPKVPTLVFADGEAQGGVKKLSFTKGDQVRFRVRSDVAEEIHVHGFDKEQDVTAGGTVAFAFPASFDGIFEVEIEGSGTQLASLEIQP